MRFRATVLRILNLDELKKTKTEPESTAPSPAPAPSTTQPLDAASTGEWEAAGLRVQAAEHSPAGAGPNEPEPERRAPAWARPQDENSGAAFARRFGRGVVWAVLGLAVISGVRSWFSSPEHPPAPAPSRDAAEQYPVQAAQAVAARWSRTYLSWDESDPDTRTRQLAADMPKGTDTNSDLGWNGKGTQTVLDVQPGQVEPGKHGHARVHVEALVQPEQSKKSKKDKPASRWIALEVPVASVHGRVVVTGEPGIVGMPTSGPDVPQHTQPQTDTAFSSKTQPVVKDFFADYAEGDAASATAPGVSVPPLPEDLQLDEVRSWSADAGRGGDRTGTAVVTWQTSGGATLEQTYRITLTRVTSSDAERWQVSSLRGGTT